MRRLLPTLAFTLAFALGLGAHGCKRGPVIVAVGAERDAKIDAAPDVPPPIDKLDTGEKIELGHGMLMMGADAQALYYLLPDPPTLMEKRIRYLPWERPHATGVARALGMSVPEWIEIVDADRVVGLDRWSGPGGLTYVERPSGHPEVALFTSKSSHVEMTTAGVEGGKELYVAITETPSDPVGLYVYRWGHGLRALPSLPAEAHALAIDGTDAYFLVGDELRRQSLAGGASTAVWKASAFVVAKGRVTATDGEFVSTGAHGNVDVRLAHEEGHALAGDALGAVWLSGKEGAPLLRGSFGTTVVTLGRALAGVTRLVLTPDWVYTVGGDEVRRFRRKD